MYFEFIYVFVCSFRFERVRSFFFSRLRFCFCFFCVFIYFDCYLLYVICEFFFYFIVCLCVVVCFFLIDVFSSFVDSSFRYA